MSDAKTLARSNENLREGKRRVERAVERVVVTNVTAAVIGGLEGAGKLPISVTKQRVPVKPIISGLSYLVGAFARGGFGRVAILIGDAAGNCYSYEAAKKKSFVAGE